MSPFHFYFFIMSGKLDNTTDRPLIDVLTNNPPTTNRPLIDVLTNNPSTPAEQITD